MVVVVHDCTVRCLCRNLNLNLSDRVNVLHVHVFAFLQLDEVGRERQVQQQARDVDGLLGGDGGAL